MASLADVRARIERAKRDVARAEGELAAAEKDREADRAKLREILGCEPGAEREALAALEKEVETAETEVVRLLDSAKHARDERGAGP